MPYDHKKLPNGKIQVSKKDTGEVVGHTTPEKFNDYMAALHMHEKYAFGGNVKPEHYTTITDRSAQTIKTPQQGEVRLPPFMAEGGDVPDIATFPPDQEEANTLAAGLPPEREDMKNMPIPPETNAPPAPATPAPAPVVPPPAVIPAPATVPAPAPTKGTSLNGEMLAAEKLLGTDANKRTALLNTLNSYRQKGQIGAGISGIGDAIASGATLGKVNPRGLEAAEGRLNENAETSLKNADVETQRKLQAFEVAKTQQKDDPNSTYSKIYAATASKMMGPYGVKIPAGASASQIEQLLGPTATVVDAQAKIELMKNESAMRMMIEEQNAKTREKEATTAAAKSVAEGSKIPFVGPSHEQKQEAIGTLLHNAGASNPEAGANEVVRTTADGRKIVYDATTKQPLREVK